jgi:hypothetical protein
MTTKAKPRRPRATATAVSPCSSSCLTKDHKTWGECIRAKGLQVSPAINDAYGTRQRAWDRELDNYAAARAQGVEPAGTQQHHIDAAMKEAGA